MEVTGCLPSAVSPCRAGTAHSTTPSKKPGTTGWMGGLYTNNNSAGIQTQLIILRNFYQYHTCTCTCVCMEKYLDCELTRLKYWLEDSDNCISIRVF